MAICFLIPQNGGLIADGDDLGDMSIAECEADGGYVVLQAAEAAALQNSTGFLPPLSVEDARTIGSALIACWVLAYIIRRLIKWSETL